MAQAGSDTRAIVALVLGILSIMLALGSCGMGGCCVSWLPLVLGGVALWLGRAVKADIDMEVVSESNAGTASAGFVTGAVGAGLSAVITLAYGVLFLLYGSMVTLAAVFGNM